MGARLNSWLLLLAVGVPAAFVRLAHDPAVWFDEGYKTNAAATLAQRGVYGTHTTSGDLPFDPGISAGPVLIVPAAASFALLGPGLVSARVVSAAFALLALLAVFEVASFLYGRHRGLFVALFAALAGAVPEVGLVRLGRQFLGEVPAAALALIGFALWFESWRRDRFGLATLAGLSCGLALLAKLQIVFGLLPALAVVGSWRLWRDRRRAATSLTPLLACVAVYGLWSAFERLATPDSVRVENVSLFGDALRSAIFTDTWVLKLSRTGMAIVLFMLAGAALRAWTRRGDRSDRGMAELAVVVFVAAYAVWFALFSIGWPRYAFAGALCAQILWGKVVYDALASAAKRLPLLRRGFAVAMALLALAALAANLVHPVFRGSDGGAHQMAQLIRDTVPPEAVLETWEWELDVLSGHENIHHPPQTLLFRAIRESGRDPSTMRDTLGYDPLQADPDFLVIGLFGEAMHVYDQTIRTDFRQLAAIGSYRLFARVR